MPHTEWNRSFREPGAYTADRWLSSDVPRVISSEQWAAMTRDERKSLLEHAEVIRENPDQVMLYGEAHREAARVPEREGCG